MECIQRASHRSCRQCRAACRKLQTVPQSRQCRSSRGTRCTLLGAASGLAETEEGTRDCQRRAAPADGPRYGAGSAGPVGKQGRTKGIAKRPNLKIFKLRCYLTRVRCDRLCVHDDSKHQVQKPYKSAGMLSIEFKTFVMNV